MEEISRNSRDSSNYGSISDSTVLTCISMHILFLTIYNSYMNSAEDDRRSDI